MAKQWMKMAALAGAMALTRLCMAADVSGDWVAQIATAGGPQYAHVSLNVDGAKLTGMWGSLKISGTLSGTKLDIALTGASGNSGGTLTGTLTGNAFVGAGAIGGKWPQRRR